MNDRSGLGAFYECPEPVEIQQIKREVFQFVRESLPSDEGIELEDWIAGLQELRGPGPGKPPPLGDGLALEIVGCLGLFLAGYSGTRGLGAQPRGVDDGED